MEAATGMASSSAVAGPSTEHVALAPFDEDARHYAVTASPVPKPTGSMGLSTAPQDVAAETGLKDLKSVGTRFHEDCQETDLSSPRLRSSRLYRGKGRDINQAEPERKRPLRLLDLPVDILGLIVKEVTHTNDLTSLALCHSALHRLTIPHIYSRFDIVWPDASVHSEPRSGVDALTYGLATLVMAEEIFGEAPSQRQAEGNNRFLRSGNGRATETVIRRRRGNHYAQFTRKFSLGNGPADWVQEYLITKEGGKMLGTLVALAVARMRALETFVWDMPTGVLRDVWGALASLGERDDGRPCRLEKVWVRWHDNSSPEVAAMNGIVPPPPPPPPLPVLPSAHAIPTPMHPHNAVSANSAVTSSIHVNSAALDRVEHPSFSILPPLKSLSVIDIDELAYLDEMAVLIGRSLDKLRELRVGIARHAITKDWVKVWQGDNLPQVDHDYPTAGSVTIGDKRNGGVLGTLTGFVQDIRRPKIVIPERNRRKSVSATPKAPSTPPPPPSSADEALAGDAAVGGALNVLTGGSAALPPSQIPESSWLRLASSSSPSLDAAYANDPLIATSQQASPEPNTPSQYFPADATIAGSQAPQVDAFESLQNQRPYLNNVLRLETLELERVPLSILVLHRAFDWSRLTSLTLLHCQNHEQLWKTLRRAFAPVPKSPTYPQARRTPASTPRKGGGRNSVGLHDVDLQYPLKLTKIHTNTVSPALITFLKETLAPNSLEVLFLQEARSYSSTVAVDAIFRGPIRRHRNSLKKLLIDSSENRIDGEPSNSNRWRRWVLSREMLAFICSGKMPALRELGMCIEWKDWHFFLQHLPAIPHLRSLYIPFLGDHTNSLTLDPRELALSIVDIVALRPEVELCYMGIATKCFEILENRNLGAELGFDALGSANVSGLDGGHGSDADDDEDGEEVDDEDDDDGLEEVDAEADTEGEDDDDDDVSETESESGQSSGSGAAPLRLREILFYDDKVAVFKARHGRL